MTSSAASSWLSEESPSAGIGHDVLRFRAGRELLRALTKLSLIGTATVIYRNQG